MTTSYGDDDSEGIHRKVGCITVNEEGGNLWPLITSSRSDTGPEPPVLLLVSKLIIVMMMTVVVIVMVVMVMIVMIMVMLMVVMAMSNSNA